MAGPSLLFVYGTLRPGGANGRGPGARIVQALERHAEHVGRASLRGRLHRISWYPALVESRSASDTVVGDVYRLNEADAVLPLLDQYEDASPAPSSAHEYTRKRKIVTLANGQRAMAWVYVYNRPAKVGERIEGGDFVRSVRKTSSDVRRRRRA